MLKLIEVYRVYVLKLTSDKWAIVQIIFRILSKIDKIV